MCAPHGRFCANNVEPGRAQHAFDRKKSRFRARWGLTPVSQTVLCPSHAGIAQLVEHDLAKVGVASSSLVSRSRKADETSDRRGFVFFRVRRARQERAQASPARTRCQYKSPSAWWQSGHVAACKAAYAGSIPTQASKPRECGIACCRLLSALTSATQRKLRAAPGWRNR